MERERGVAVQLTAGPTDCRHSSSPLLPCPHFLLHLGTPPPRHARSSPLSLSSPLGLVATTRTVKPILLPRQITLLWEGAVGSLKISLDGALEELQQPEVMVLLKDFVMLVCGALSKCGYDITVVQVSPSDPLASDRAFEGVQVRGAPPLGNEDSLLAGGEGGASYWRRRGSWRSQLEAGTLQVLSACPCPSLVSTACALAHHLAPHLLLPHFRTCCSTTGHTSTTSSWRPWRKRWEEESVDGGEEGGTAPREAFPIDPPRLLHSCLSHYTPSRLSASQHPLDLPSVLIRSDLRSDPLSSACRPPPCLIRTRAPRG